jgi:hypothetical protein
MQARDTTTTIAEGIARLFEKHIASQHAAQTQDIAILTKPADQPTDLVVSAERLPGPHKDAIDQLLRRETNRAAFRNIYRHRVAAFRQTLAAMEEDVATELAAMPQPEVVIGVRGRSDTRIVISRGPGAAADGQQQEESAETTRPRAAPKTKSSLRDGVIWAAQQALAELGVDPEQPYSATLATQLALHPQLRSLVLLALPEGMKHAAEKELRMRTAVGEAAAAGAGDGAARRLTRNSRPRKKAPLIKVAVKQKRPAASE